MTEHHLGQAEVARQIGVSQATVSRVLERGYCRQSKARRKIENFLRLNASKLHNSTEVPLEICLAVRQVWNKTKEHAHMLARVIHALDGLVPSSLESKNGGSNNQP